MPKVEKLRAAVSSKPEGVDRDARVIRGYVLAQEGPFKSAGRGEFDKDGLQGIVKLGNGEAKGLKSRFGHPNMSDDGLGKYLGRARQLRMSTAIDARTGKSVPAVRGDLHFSETASKTPSGDLADYVMSLAESDAGAISSSLVIEADQQFRLDDKKRPLLDADGNELPPIWIPKRLHASDIVDTGDAVDGLLSAALSTQQLDSLLRFDGPARIASYLAGIVTAGQSRAEAEKRLLSFVSRFMTETYGETEPTPRLDALCGRLAELQQYFQSHGA